MIRKAKNLLKLILPIQSRRERWANLKNISNVDTLIDVGVAYGTPDLYRHLSYNQLILVEPVPFFQPKIKKILSSQPNASYFPFALGLKEGKHTINFRQDAPVMTSMYESSTLRRSNHNEIIEKIEIDVHKLDNVFSKFSIKEKGSIFLKIDAEGAEMDILKGGIASLNKIKYIMVEVSVIERFQGSYTCNELFVFMQKHNFFLHTILSSSEDNNGYCRTVDAVFVNSKL